LVGGGASFTYAKETNYKAYIEWMGKIPRKEMFG
jgi:hypothetical protein